MFCSVAFWRLLQRQTQLLQHKLRGDETVLLEASLLAQRNSLIPFKIPISLTGHSTESLLCISEGSFGAGFICPLLQQGLQLARALESQLQSLRAEDGHLAEHPPKRNTQVETILTWLYPSPTPYCSCSLTVCYSSFFIAFIS